MKVPTYLIRKCVCMGTHVCVYWVIVRDGQPPRPGKESKTLLVKSKKVKKVNPGREKRLGEGLRQRNFPREKAPPV